MDTFLGKTFRKLTLRFLGEVGGGSFREAFPPDGRKEGVRSWFVVGERGEGRWEKSG